MPITGKEMLKRYLDDGWSLVRTKGSHHVMRKGSKTETIPVHGNRDLKRGTEHALLKTLKTTKAGEG